MAAAIVVLWALVVVIVVSDVLRRRRADRRSPAGYRHGMDVLARFAPPASEDAAQPGASQAHVHIVESHGLPVAEPAGPHRAAPALPRIAPPRHVSEPVAFRDGALPLSFGDGGPSAVGGAAPHGAGGRSPAVADLAGRSHPHATGRGAARRRAVLRGPESPAAHRGPARRGAALLGAVVAVVLGLAASLLATGGGSRPAAVIRPPRPPAARPAPAAPAVATPPAVAAAPLTPTAVQSGEATWAAPPAASTLEVAARGAACWVEARSGAGGPVLFEGTLAAGESRSFPVGSGLWVRVGDVGAASVTLGDRPLDLPVGGPVPYNLVVSPTVPVG